MFTSLGTLEAGSSETPVNMPKSGWNFAVLDSVTPTHPSHHTPTPPTKLTKAEPAQTPNGLKLGYALKAAEREYNRYTALIHYRTE